MEKGTEMFSRILKNDLKRKKTMNIILMIFVILSVMFASGSINIMISVYGGIDYFLEKAEMSDCVMLTKAPYDNNPAEYYFENATSVTSYSKETIIFYSATNLFKDSVKYVEFENPGVITSVDDAKINYFDRNNEVITEIEKGHIYLGGILASKEEVQPGDVIELRIEDVTLELTVDGFVKDALLGSPFIGNPRMLMNDEDVQTLLASEKIRNLDCGAIFYAYTDDIKLYEKEISDVPNSMFSSDSSILMLTYMIDMLTAALMLIVSICLILIAFAMLSFTIKFTISEDFREIGVMKAIGLKNSSVRGLYMIKYICISSVGAVIGYLLSRPFEDLLLGSITDKIVIGNDNSVATGIITAIAVVLIIVAFCFSCTKAIKKLSPVDAVRNGETGERHHKKSVLRLYKSRLGSNLFLGLNDVVSKPRQYMSMIITFTITLLLIMLLANTANTLASDKLLFLLGTTRSDVYYNSTDKAMEFMGSENEDRFYEIEDEIKQTMADNGMPCDIHEELMYSIPIEFGDFKSNYMMQQCKDTHTTDYVYSSGTAPLYENEIALSTMILDDLGAEIGDTVILTINDERKEFIITASLVTFNQLGKCGRLHESVDIQPNQAASVHPFQINFTDNPDDAEIEARIEKMQDIFGTDKIYDAKDFVDSSTRSAGPIATAKNLVLMITLMIAILITVLMERSFLSKEIGEIALQKAIGFRSSAISTQHTLRFIVVIIVSSIIAIALNIPFTKLVSDRIFAIMGATSGIEYKIMPLEVFVLYPVILAAVVGISAFLTSLFARTINADDMGNIE
jgi:putative ABC transport system permease protein